MMMMIKQTFIIGNGNVERFQQRATMKPCRTFVSPSAPKHRPMMERYGRDDGIFARPGPMNLKRRDSFGHGLVADSVTAPSEVPASSVASSCLSTKMLGKKRVLREHEFVDGLGRVIEQQFFPNLKRLKAQAAGVELHADAIDAPNSCGHTDTLHGSDHTAGSSAYTAPREGDLDKLGSARSKLFQLAGLTLPSAPNDGTETDASNTEEKPLRVYRNSRTATSQTPKESVPATIDQYLSKHTSQDNYEYHKIQNKDLKKHREKHAWAYSACETESQGVLQLQDKARLLLQNTKNPKKVGRQVVKKKDTHEGSRNGIDKIRYSATQYEEIETRLKASTVRKQTNTKDYRNSQYGGGDDQYSLVFSSSRGGASSITGRSSMMDSASRLTSASRYRSVPHWGSSGVSSIHSSSRSNRIKRMSHSARALAIKLLDMDHGRRQRRGF